MLTSLAFIFLFGLLAASLCSFFRLPRIIGMLLVGILLGPKVLNLLDSSILLISGDLRKMALVIILLKAGLSFDAKDLLKVGRPALLMSFLPACCEILASVLLAPMLFGVSRAEGAVIGAVLGAVSPAVVVPKMVSLMEERYGTEKKIPQMILAGASLDDVFVIVLFSTFLSMLEGQKVSALTFLSVPVKIVLGIGLGIVVGMALSFFFDDSYRKGKKIRASMKVVLLLGFAFLLMATENWLEGVLPLSGLLAVTAMASTIHMMQPEKVSGLLSKKFGRLWVGAEVILFVLVGASVDISYTLSAGPNVLLLLFFGLFLRSLGVLLSLWGTNLKGKERAFVVISYLPKATVQAAIGSIPLSMGLSCGNLVLSTAVVAILITAPLGAFGMDLTYRRLLEKEA